MDKREETRARARTVRSVIQRLASAASAGMSVAALVAASGCYGTHAGTPRGEELDQIEPVVPELSNRVIEIALGEAHSCALREDGAVFCWGSNAAGQVGVPVSDAAEIGAPMRVSGVDDAVAIAAGASHSCALLADGTARCWGDNTSGQLGPQARGLSASVSPRLMTAPAGIEAVVAGGDRTCIVSAGQNECFGVDVSERFTRAASDVSELSVYDTRGCVVEGPRAQSGAALGGSVHCWSADGAAERVEGLLNARSISVGREHACAIQPDAQGLGEVFCWGRNRHGELGYGAAPDPLLTLAMPVGVARVHRSYVGVSAGRSTTCALSSEGAVDCWGRDYAAQEDRVVPETVPLAAPATEVRVGARHACAIDDAQQVQCWGENDRGQLGGLGSAVVHVAIPSALTEP